MRHLFMSVIVLGVAACVARAADHPAEPRLEGLTRDLYRAADDISEQQVRFGSRVKNFLHVGREHANVYSAFRNATRDLHQSAERLGGTFLARAFHDEPGTRERERRFVERWNVVADLSGQVRQALAVGGQPEARLIFNRRVLPALAAIHRTLPALSIVHPAAR